MLKMTHKDLVDISEKWLLKSKGCGFAIKEVFAADNNEIPDAIGFRSGISILIESKTTRADFHADKKKIFRRCPSMGMGAFRFFLCPAGVIKPEDLPEKWGLIWVNENGVARQKVGPKGNIWNCGKKEFFFSKRCIKSEWNMMASALRRLHIRGVLPQIYDTTPWD